MTEDVSPESVSFTVPITTRFAEFVAQALGGFRVLAADGFPEEPIFAADFPFKREVEAHRALPQSVGAARMSLLNMLSKTSQLLWDNALDHVRALETDVLMTPPPVWSPLTLSRTVMENVLIHHYLLDSSIAGGLRLARFAGLWRTDIGHMGKMADALGHPGATASTASTDARANKLLADAGIRERFNAKGKLIGHEVDGDNARLDINITEQAGKALPTWIPAPYRLLSGAAHGRPWMIERARMLAQGTDDRLVGEAATLMTAAMVVFGSLEVAVTTWQNYYGADLTTVRREMETRRTQFPRQAAAMVNAVEA
ncbi:hypothetical protein [Embleya sp. NBC_00896]|uniref:hypothetical protein n=1 Tax=Embleya sp. NBC_00896 TaxID=2975961 RepID=UPI002F917E97|nr:hypothetical protein OG928_47175 [Embleya sp. NBC_00896]